MDCDSDFYVTIYTKIHASEGPEQRLEQYSQEIIFSTYGPPSQEFSIQDDYRRTPDDVYIQTTTKGEIIAFNFKASVMNKQADTRLLWANSGFKDNV